MVYELELRALVNPKTKKLVHVRYSTNSWLCQVVVEGKRWSTVYFADPPLGPVSFKAGSVSDARDLVFMKAHDDAVEWLPTLLLKNNGQESDHRDTGRF